MRNPSKSGVMWILAAPLVAAACASTPRGPANAATACRPSPLAGVYGQVVDEASGEPLASVQVWTEPATDVWRTNSRGCFQLDPRIKRRSYMVRFRRDPGEAADMAYWDKHENADYRGEPLDLGIIKLAREQARDIGPAFEGGSPGGHGTVVPD